MGSVVIRSSLFRLAIALGLLLSAALVVGAPAQAAEPTSMTFYAQRAKVVVGDPLEFTVNLTTTGESPVGERTVTLERQIGGGDWIVVDTDETQAHGQRILHSTAVENASYRAVFAGDDQYDPATSATVKLKVMRDAGVKLKNKGNKVKIHGKVKPAWKKKTVTLQTKKGAKWKAFRTKKTTNASKWSFLVPRGGKYYRVVIKKDSRFVKSVSYAYWVN